MTFQPLYPLPHPAARAQTVQQNNRFGITPAYSTELLALADSAVRTSASTVDKICSWLVFLVCHSKANQAGALDGVVEQALQRSRGGQHRG
ncbi:hypothetical protein [Micromonospora sp. U21]|uniref:hypothetical protein n=1 Tax=Micromonospora sp. U21 TaxID=2824899 RepID=UPI001B373BBF|nr:hypothetical protein [Micromonospora sp. U21]MBQ0906740.1 hypothetical protein [Micromonospora sp. U21]